MVYATVFLDILIGKKKAGRLLIDLSEKCPKTSLNFKCLCTGEKLTPERPLSYKGSTFHSVI